MSTTLLISIISTAVVYAATVLYAAVGEIFSQRAGIMNLGLEGIMLMGAVSGYMVAVYRQNLVLAMLVVILVGAALGLVFSFLTVTMQADQTVSGMAMLVFRAFWEKASAASTPIWLLSPLRYPGFPGFRYSALPFLTRIYWYT